MWDCNYPLISAKTNNSVLPLRIGLYYVCSRREGLFINRLNAAKVNTVMAASQPNTLFLCGSHPTPQGEQQPFAPTWRPVRGVVCSQRRADIDMRSTLTTCSQTVPFAPATCRPPKPSRPLWFGLYRGQSGVADWRNRRGQISPHLQHRRSCRV